jgi:hypothetical protein
MNIPEKNQGSMNFQAKFLFGEACSKILGLSNSSFSWRAGDGTIGVSVVSLKSAVFTAEQKTILDEHVFIQNEGTHPRIALAKSKMTRLVAEEHAAAAAAAAAAAGTDAPEVSNPANVGGGATAAAAANEDYDDNDEYDNFDSVGFHRFLSEGEIWQTYPEEYQPCSAPNDFPDNYVMVLREAEPTDFVQNKGSAAILALVRKNSKTFPPVNIKNWGRHETLNIEIINSSMKTYRPTPNSSSPPNDEPIYLQMDFSLQFI